MLSSTTGFLTYFYIGGSLSIFRSGALTFFVKLALLFVIDVLLAPEAAVILDYCMILDRFADSNFRVLLLLLLTC